MDERQKMVAKATTTAESLLREVLTSDGRIKGQYYDGSKSGISRQCIIRDGIAYKVAKAPGYRRFNIAEYLLYHEMPPSVQSLMITPYYMTQCGAIAAWELVPETFDDRYGDSYGSINTEEYDDYQSRTGNFSERLERLLVEDAGYSAIQAGRLMSDNHGKNVGIREDGSVVWLDFAPPRLHGGIGEDPDPDRYGG